VLDDPATTARLRFTGLLAVALVLASWTTVFTDQARAVAMVEEAAGLAAGAPSSVRTG
jgi:hypothetical protein